MKLQVVFSLLIGTLVLLFVQSVSAQDRVVPIKNRIQAFNTFYVSPEGLDTNPGTLELPFKTVQKGINSITQPGDSVIVRGGVYSEKINIGSSKSGNSTNRVVIQAYAGETPILDGTNVTFVNDGDKMVNIGASYVTFSGFEVRNAQAKGISVDGNYNIIENNKVHDLRRYGISVYRWLNSPIPTGNIIRNNEVYNVMLKNLQGAMGGGGWDAIIAVGGDNAENIGPTETTIEGNIVHHGWGEGIMCFGGATKCYIRKNTVYESWSVLIYLAGTSESIVEKNFIYDHTPLDTTNGTTRRYTPLGFNVNTESEDCFNRDNIIRNNIVVGARVGVNYANYSADNAARATACTGFINTTVEYNTFYHTQDYGIKIEEGKNTGALFRNNIFYSTLGNFIKYSNPNPAYNVTYTKPVFQNNLFYNPTGSSLQSFKWNQDTTGMGNATNNFDDYVIDPAIPTSHRKNLTFTQWNSYSDTPEIATIIGNVWGDPLFTNASTTSANITDFRVQSTSPAKNISATSTVIEDLNGQTRTVSGSTLGALQYNAGKTVIPTQTPPLNVSISQWSLIDTDTQTVVTQYENVLDKTIIDLRKMSTKKINFKVTPSTTFNGSVVFHLNGNIYATDNSAPYSMAGETNGSYNRMELTTGIYTLKATPYSQPNGQGQAGTPSEIKVYIVNGTWWISVLDALKFFNTK